MSAKYSLACRKFDESKIKVGSLIAYRGIYLSCAFTSPTRKPVSATFIIHYLTTAIYLCATSIWLPPGVILSIVLQKQPQFSFIWDALSSIPPSKHLRLTDVISCKYFSFSALANRLIKLTVQSVLESVCWFHYIYATAWCQNWSFF